MSRDLYIGSSFGRVTFDTEYDERTKTGWVSEVALTTDSGWYQNIRFGYPHSIDNLIYALVTAKAEAAALHNGDIERTIEAVRDAGHTERVGTRGDDGMYHCPWCNTPIIFDDSVYTDGRPQFCGECGLRLTDFVETANG